MSWTQEPALSAASQGYQAADRTTLVEEAALGSQARPSPAVGPARAPSPASPASAYFPQDPPPLVLGPQAPYSPSPLGAGTAMPPSSGASTLVAAPLGPQLLHLFPQALDARGKPWAPPPAQQGAVTGTGASVGGGPGWQMRAHQGEAQNLKRHLLTLPSVRPQPSPARPGPNPGWQHASSAGAPTQAPLLRTPAWNSTGQGQALGASPVPYSYGGIGQAQAQTQPTPPMQPMQPNLSLAPRPTTRPSLAGGFASSPQLRPTPAPGTAPPPLHSGGTPSPQLRPRDSPTLRPGPAQGASLALGLTSSDPAQPQRLGEEYSHRTGPGLAQYPGSTVPQYFGQSYTQQQSPAPVVPSPAHSYLRTQSQPSSFFQVMPSKPGQVQNVEAFQAARPVLLHSASAPLRPPPLLLTAPAAQGARHVGMDQSQRSQGQLQPHVASLAPSVSVGATPGGQEHAGNNKLKAPPLLTLASDNPGRFNVSAPASAVPVKEHSTVGDTVMANPEGPQQGRVLPEEGNEREGLAEGETREHPGANAMRGNDQQGTVGGVGVHGGKGHGQEDGRDGEGGFEPKPEREQQPPQQTLSLPVASREAASPSKLNAEMLSEVPSVQHRPESATAGNDSPSSPPMPTLVLPPYFSSLPYRHNPGAPLADHQSRFLALQSRLREVEDSNYSALTAALETMSAAERSRQAASAEKRNLTLVMDEVQEMRRAQRLGVLAKRRRLDASAAKLSPSPTPQSQEGNEAPMHNHAMASGPTDAAMDRPGDSALMPSNEKSQACGGNGDGGGSSSTNSPQQGVPLTTIPETSTGMGLVKTLSPRPGPVTSPHTPSPSLHFPAAVGPGSTPPVRPPALLRPSSPSAKQGGTQPRLLVMPPGLGGQGWRRPQP